jgi:hypothetical protein
VTVVSAYDVTRVRVCPSPGCPNVIRVGDLCDDCKRLPAKRKKAIVRQAYIQRAALVEAERMGQELVRRRHRRSRLREGRFRAVAQLDRLADQARRRGDPILEQALHEARGLVEEAVR